LVWIYTLLSVFVVSLISLIGIFTLSVSQEKLSRILIYLVSFAAGTLLGDAFIHLIPESFNQGEESIQVSFFILLGILIFFILEKFIHWRHCHKIACDDHPHPFSYIILVGDSAHNFIDGMVIAASYLVNIPLGLATTLAVIFHEIPQEIGDFGSLVYGGFSRVKALIFNFLTALFAVGGSLLILFINLQSEKLINFLIPLTAGGFIYIASSDLIPELHKQSELKKSFWQLFAFILGIGLMFLLLAFE